jgi:hypothetical protein
MTGEQREGGPPLSEAGGRNFYNSEADTGGKLLRKGSPRLVKRKTRFEQIMD